MDTLARLLPDPELIVFGEVEIDQESKRIVCKASVIDTTAACPLCQQISKRIHSHY